MKNTKIVFNLDHGHEFSCFSGQSEREVTKSTVVFPHQISTDQSQSLDWTMLILQKWIRCYCGRFTSFTWWCCVIGWVVPDALNDHNSFETSRITSLVTPSHSRRLLFQQHCCENLRSHKILCLLWHNITVRRYVTAHWTGILNFHGWWPVTLNYKLCMHTASIEP
jgi:hypothetical protein